MSAAAPTFDAMQDGTPRCASSTGTGIAHRNDRIDTAGLLPKWLHPR